MFLWDFSTTLFPSWREGVIRPVMLHALEKSRHLSTLKEATDPSPENPHHTELCSIRSSRLHLGPKALFKAPRTPDSVLPRSDWLVSFLPALILQLLWFHSLHGIIFSNQRLITQRVLGFRNTQLSGEAQVGSMRTVTIGENRAFKQDPGHQRWTPTLTHDVGRGP